MNYCKIVVTFISEFSRGEIITLIGIIVGIIIPFVIYVRKNRRERIDAFLKTVLPFKGILETNSIPDHAGYDGFITNLISDQDKAMTIIRDKMNEKTKKELDRKWVEYEVKREGLKRYWETDLIGKVNIHRGSDSIIKLIDGIIKIVEKN
jgi:hypothetical protein